MVDAGALPQRLLLLLRLRRRPLQRRLVWIRGTWCWCRQLLVASTKCRSSLTLQLLLQLLLLLLVVEQGAQAYSVPWDVLRRVCGRLLGGQPRRGLLVGQLKLRLWREPPLLGLLAWGWVAKAVQRDTLASSLVGRLVGLGQRCLPRPSPVWSPLLRERRRRLGLLVHWWDGGRRLLGGPRSRGSALRRRRQRRLLLLLLQQRQPLPQQLQVGRWRAGVVGRLPGRSREVLPCCQLLAVSHSGIGWQHLLAFWPRRLQTTLACT